MLLSALAPLVEVVQISGLQVVFRSKRQFRLGSEVRARARLTRPGAPRASTVLFKARVNWTRPEGVAYTCVGQLTSKLPFEPVLQGPEAAVRTARRVTCRFRVVSADLPGFLGLSVDVSRTGLQVESRGELPLGSVVKLRLEPNMSDWDSVTFRARVAWHHQKSHRLHRMGLEYLEMDDDSRDRLNNLERYLQARETALISQLVLKHADQFLLANAF